MWHFNALQLQDASLLYFRVVALITTYKKNDALLKCTILNQISSFSSNTPNPLINIRTRTTHDMQKIMPTMFNFFAAFDASSASSNFPSLYDSRTWKLKTHENYILIRNFSAHWNVTYSQQNYSWVQYITKYKYIRLAVTFYDIFAIIHEFHHIFSK